MLTKDRIRGIGRSKPEAKENAHSKQRNHLLVIGIDEYSKPFRKLKNCKKDCKDFVELVHRRYQGFIPERTTELYNKKAKRENIFSQLENYRDLGPEDNLIIYFAGHGKYDDREKRASWIPCNAKDPSNYISSDDVKNKIRAIDACHVVLIVDTCFGGRINNGDMDEAAHKFARRVLYSGYEKVSDGHENSPFAQALLFQLEWNLQPTDRFTMFAQRVIEKTLKDYEFFGLKPKQTPDVAVFLGTNRNGEFVWKLSAEEIEKANENYESSPKTKKTPKSRNNKLLKENIIPANTPHKNGKMKIFEVIIILLIIGLILLFWR